METIQFNTSKEFNNVAKQNVIHNCSILVNNGFSFDLFDNDKFVIYYAPEQVDLIIELINEELI